MQRSIVAGADFKVFDTLRTFQLDAVKRSVVFQLGRFVDQTILIAKVRLNGAQVVIDRFV
jgi:hypothetical protein